MGRTRQMVSTMCVCKAEQRRNIYSKGFKKTKGKGTIYNMFKWLRPLDSHIAYATHAVTFTTHCKIMSRRGRIHIHIKSSRRSYILLRNITTVDHFDTLPIIYKFN